jgi:hypothetical protein
MSGGGICSLPWWIGYPVYFTGKAYEACVGGHWRELKPWMLESRLTFYGRKKNRIRVKAVAQEDDQNGQAA